MPVRASNLRCPCASKTTRSSEAASRRSSRASRALSLRTGFHDAAARLLDEVRPRYRAALRRGAARARRLPPRQPALDAQGPFFLDFDDFTMGPRCRTSARRARPDAEAAPSARSSSRPTSSCGPSTGAASRSSNAARAAPPALRRLDRERYEDPAFRAAFPDFLDESFCAARSPCSSSSGRSSAGRDRPARHQSPGHEIRPPLSRRRAPSSPRRDVRDERRHHGQERREQEQGEVPLVEEHRTSRSTVAWKISVTCDSSLGATARVARDRGARSTRAGTGARSRRDAGALGEPARRARSSPGEKARRARTRRDADDAERDQDGLDALHRSEAELAGHSPPARSRFANSSSVQ